jgi:pantetheine-phosphate adenylyltransferase
MRTIAIYPGSFNPFHIGHLNIVEKAERIFGKGNVIIAIGINPEKVLDINSDYYEQKEAEAKILSDKIGRPVIIYYKFLHQLVETYEKLPIDGEKYNPVIIRGLRNGDDFDYEVNQFRFIDDFKKNINVVYLTCDKEYEHISSSAIRNIEKFGGYGSADKYKC